MSQKLKLAVIGAWHVHTQEYIERSLETGRAELSILWDDVPERGEAVAKKYDLPFTIDLEEALSVAGLDGILCCSMTTQHVDILPRAARKGLAIFTEKAIAPTMDEARTIARAIEEAGVPFTICFPQRHFPEHRFIKELVDAGKLGTISAARFRNGHNGLLAGWLPDYWMREEEAGGGAIMDLGCHPLYLMTYYLGMPQTAASALKAEPSSRMDEAGCFLFHFPDGATATCESSLISFATPNITELYGDKGTVLLRNNEILYRTEDSGSDEWQRAELPEAGTHPLVDFIEALCEGRDVDSANNLQAALQLTAVLEAGYRAHQEEQVVTVEEA